MLAAYFAVARAQIEGASSGEGFLTGEASNTASRVQSVAPENGVATGLAKYEAKALVFEYEELEHAKKAGPERRLHPRNARPADRRHA